MKGIYKHFILICFFTISSVSIFSQNLIVKSNGATYSGITLIRGNDKLNAKICRMAKINNVIVVFTPDSLLRYRFKNNRLFISETIDIAGTQKKVFLEKLVDDTTSLYHYVDDEHDIFFLQKNEGELIMMKENNGQFQGILQQLLDSCVVVNQVIPKVKFNKRALYMLVKAYNQCDLWDFSIKTFGIFAGGSYVFYSPGKNLTGVDFKKTFGATLGLFIDYPLVIKHLYFHPEFVYSYANLETKEPVKTGLIAFKTNISTLAIPLLIRYKIDEQRMKPFFNAGLAYAQNFVKVNENYKSFMALYSMSKKELYPKADISMIGGLGFQYNLNMLHSIYLELRYSRSFSPFDISNTLAKNEILFNFGFNF